MIVEDIYGSLLFIDLIDELVDFGKVGLVVCTHKVKGAHVKTGSLANNYQQQVLTDLHLSYEVLIIHHIDFKVVAVSEFVELSFEIAVKLVHATTESIEEVVIGFLFEFQIICNVFVNFNVIFQLRHDKALNERILPCILMGFYFQVLRLHVLRIIIY